MKRYLLTIFFILFAGFIHTALAQESTTRNIEKSDYFFETDTIFPSSNKTATTDNGVNNIRDLVVQFFIPFLTTLMAIGATFLVVWGGFLMVMGGADTEQTEKGKTIIKDTLIGLCIGLLAYVIITTLGNILDI